MSSHSTPDHDRGASRHTSALWLAAAAAALGLLSGCGGASSAEPSTQDSAYCTALADARDDFGAVQAGNAEKFDEAFAAFHALAEEAPTDLAPDWEVFDGALLALEEDLAGLGLEVADLAAISAGEIPRGVDPADLATVSDLLLDLVSDDVAAAANNIERHALDECDIELAA